MGDKFDVLAVKPNGVDWRVFELECLEKYFGQSLSGRPEDQTIEGIINSGAKYVFWKLHTESTDESLLIKCYSIARYINTIGIKQINDPRAWINCHAKEKAFEVWKREGIPCPKWFTFVNEGDFFQKNFLSYPMLIRINNSTSGWFSYLVSNEVQLKEAIRALQRDAMNYHHDKIPNTGVGRKMIAVEYIPTTRFEKVNLSFRIIVAGNHVVTGYARIGPASDWIAITNRFEPWMEDVFVKYQKLCQKFCEENEELIVKAVNVLGLNFQGVDVILDQKDNPYFIEVQPGFSVGYPNRISWKPPFYNPTKPEALRQFLINNEKRLKEEIPMYYNLWLDKYAMFNKAFQSLKEQLG